MPTALDESSRMGREREAREEEQRERMRYRLQQIERALGLNPEYGKQHLLATGVKREDLFRERRALLRRLHPLEAAQTFLQEFGGAARGRGPYFWEEASMRNSPYASHEEEVQIRLGIDTFSRWSTISRGVARRVHAKREGTETVRQMSGLRTYPSTTLWVRFRGCGAAYRPVKFLVVDSEINVIGIEAVRECGLLVRPA